MTTRRPLIGITTDCDDKRTAYKSYFDYATAVEKAGGLPVLIPYQSDLSLVPQFVDAVDGILFTGGDDLDPTAWGERYHEKAEPIDPARERFERALIAEVERRRLPALGICLGSQLMNVHRGGTLFQFLPEQHACDAPLEHRKLDDPSRRHDAKVVADCCLAARLPGASCQVNTSHKQAVRTVGRGLRVIATAPDGVIEGIEDPTLPLFLGVQWHPERLHDDPQQLAIFRLLVEKAASTEPRREQR